MITWPKAQKKFPYMGEPFFYGALCECEETGERTGIRAACYVRPPTANPTLPATEVDWILCSIASRLSSKQAKSRTSIAVRCLRCPTLCTADVWFMRLGSELGGPWCSDCLDTRVREDLGLDVEVDEGLPLYLVHVNQGFLTTLPRPDTEAQDTLPNGVDPKNLF